MAKKFGVIGFPIGHSMSPFIHKELFRLRGIEVEYEKYEVAPEALSDLFDSTLGALDGFNVTIPHKLGIIPCCDELDAAATEYGAVNTVALRDGKHIGYNTDAYGFLEGLRFSDIPLAGRVLIYGFGGAARTLITEALKADCEVFIGTINELKASAEQVAAELSEKNGKEIKVLTNEEITEPFDLLVNASPVGMYPKVDASPLTAEQVDLFTYVYDIVYNPADTKLLQFARLKGKVCGGGMSMLVCQAIKGHEHWYGATFSKEETASVIAESVKEMERIFSK